MSQNNKEKSQSHGKFQAAEKLLNASSSLEEMLEFHGLMLEHLHRFEADPEFAEGPVVTGFRLLIAAIEAKIRLKEFLLSEAPPQQDD